MSSDIFGNFESLMLRGIFCGGVYHIGRRQATAGYHDILACRDDLQSSSQMGVVDVV
ncbi:hypothetical protein [Porphyromonas cangingivalis]|uniref:hypothetical protein n=1 Tax=Porphyromonas cangingivalis TaxID=36874 RepID=UPI000B30B063|nr:hypothetical protein [Porphyromonas cangingivalis]